jgi:hypothetical protein
VADGGKFRSIGGFLSRFGHQPADGEPVRAKPHRGHADEGPAVPTKALPKFLAYLSSRPAPVLLDLGPVVGTNLTFFGERLNCKVHIEDIFADLDRHVGEGTFASFPEFLRARLRLPEQSVDGVLLWDLFDYLDRASARTLASALVPLIRVDGALLGFFGSAAAGSEPGFTKFLVVDEGHLRHRHSPSRATRQRSLQNRDIIKMFEGLRVSDSFLLRNNVREILFRKPQSGTSGRQVL